VVDGADIRVGPADPQPSASNALVPVIPATAPAVPAAALVEQASRTVLGVVLIAIDGITHVVEQASTGEQVEAPTGAHGLGVASRRVAVGLAFASQRQVLKGMDVAVRVAGPSVRWLAENPMLQAVTAPLQRQLESAYEAGKAEEDRARAIAGRSGQEAVQLAVPVVLEGVDVDTLVDQLLGAIDVGALIERVLGEVDMKPVIDRVMGQMDLPLLVENVMGELDLDPIIQQVLSDLDLPALVNEVVGEMQMSSVVMQATGGMTGEVLGELRNRSADGDALIERIVAKVLRRRLTELPPPSDHEDGTQS
jgi:hypothetical protein